MFNISGRSSPRAQIGRRNLAAGHNLGKPAASAFGSNLFCRRRNKMAETCAAAFSAIAHEVPAISAAFVGAGLIS
jgi:hypothetical protein